jgi:hypothetical protein
MEGEQYLSVNPATLVDANLWSYRDLQKLAKFAQIRANQKREVLVDELLHWNRKRKNGTQTLVTQDRYDSLNVENLDMNVVGNNFALLAVQAVEKKSSSAATHASPAVKAKKRKSILGLAQNEVGVVSPTLLRPLKLDMDTPHKSCLKKLLKPMTPVGDKISTEANTFINSNSALHIKFDDEDDSDIPLALVTPKKAANICFSPFNSVKVIAHKDEIAYQEYLMEHEEEFRWQSQQEEDYRLDEADNDDDADSSQSVSPPPPACLSPQEEEFVFQDDLERQEQAVQENKRLSSSIFQYCADMLSGL